GPHPRIDGDPANEVQDRAACYLGHRTTSYAAGCLSNLNSSVGAGGERTFFRNRPVPAHEGLEGGLATAGVTCSTSCQSEGPQGFRGRPPRESAVCHRAWPFKPGFYLSIASAGAVLFTIFPSGAAIRQGLVWPEQLARRANCA